MRRAYEAAGIVMPPHAWGKPAKEWLKDEAAHTRKNAVYPEMLRLHARKLPLLQHCLGMRAPIITGASPIAISHLYDFVNDRRLHIMLWGATLDDKCYWLWKKSCQSEPGTHHIYVDDDPNARSYIEGMTRHKWHVLSPEQAFTRLSSPRGPTPDLTDSSPVS